MRLRLAKKVARGADTLESDLVAYLEAELADFLDMDARTLFDFFRKARRIEPANQRRYSLDIGLLSANEIIEEIRRDTARLYEETQRRIAYRAKLIEVAATLGHFGLRLALAIILV